MNFYLILTITLQLFATISARQFRVTDQVYFDVKRENVFLGRIVIGLFGDLAPRAVKNFKVLATKGINGKSYRGTSFNRIIKRFMIQGGDVVSDDGKGSISIYGETFEDENLDTQHAIAGFVSMANKGRNTNGCQFIITVKGTPWLDGLHTVVGKVYMITTGTDGLTCSPRHGGETHKDCTNTQTTTNICIANTNVVVEGQKFVHMIEQTPTDVDDRPEVHVYIADCGLLPTQPFYVSDDYYDLWGWIKASALPLSMSFSILAFFHWMIKQMHI